MLYARLKGQALWGILVRRNMSQNELARKAGLSSGYLSQLVRGDRFPSPAVRRKLLKALALRGFDDLFEIVTPPPARGKADGAGQ